MAVNGTLRLTSRLDYDNDRSANGARWVTWYSLDTARATVSDDRVRVKVIGDGLGERAAHVDTDAHAHGSVGRSGRSGAGGGDGAPRSRDAHGLGLPLDREVLLTGRAGSLARSGTGRLAGAHLAPGAS